MSPRAVDRLRAICTALPEVTERTSHGEVAFFAGTSAKPRQFVMLDVHHHGAGHVGFWCAAPAGAQEALIAADPQRYYRPPYVGHRGWVGVRIDLSPDWDEVAEVVLDAWRQVVPARLRAELPDRL